MKRRTIILLIGWGLVIAPLVAGFVFAPLFTVHGACGQQEVSPVGGLVILAWVLLAGLALIPMANWSERK